MRYILNIQVISTVIVVGAALYYIITCEKKVYPYAGLGDVKSVNASFSGVAKRTKKEKKERKSERRCREIFTSLFNKPFKSVRPDWLENPVTGKCLELDGYCPDIVTPIGKGLAFEYDGEQHSRYVPHFHRRGPKEFEYSLKKDSWKDMRCKEKGVMLIRIPSFVSYWDMERYIELQLKVKGVRY